MGLHIEITGPLDAREWDAVAALVAVMGGRAPDLKGAPVKPAAAAKPEPLPEKRGEETQHPADTAPGELQADPPRDASYGIAPPPPGTAPVAVPPPPPGSAIAPPASLTAPSGAELDSEGYPWDARIHASTKTKKKDETWTALRRVDASLVTAVQAELKAALAAAPQPVADAPAHADEAAAFGTPPKPPAEATPIAAPEATVAAPPPPDAAVAGASEFAAVMKLVVQKQAAGILTTEMVSAIAKGIGLPDIRSLQLRPDLIPAFKAKLP